MLKFSIMKIPYPLSNQSNFNGRPHQVTLKVRDIPEYGLTSLVNRLTLYVPKCLILYTPEVAVDGMVQVMIAWLCPSTTFVRIHLNLFI